jgi:hypothetical protein
LKNEIYADYGTTEEALVEFWDKNEDNFVTFHRLAGEISTWFDFAV